jgi:glutamate-1-semialdehyde aminotransferase
MANGMPLSAIVGRRDIMMEMENIFFSGTFGGELLSLASANYVIDKVLRGEVISQLSSIGDKLGKQVEEIAIANDLSNTLALSGHDSWKFLNWTGTNGYTSNEIKTFFMQEMFDTGILILSTHNVSLAHKQKELKEIIKGYEIVLGKMKKVIRSGQLRENLRVSPLDPLFKVR